MNKIIAVDFDGTLCTGNYPDAGKQKLIHKIILWYVKKEQKKGAIIILNTLRNTDELIKTALAFCNTHNFYPDLVNENYQPCIDKYKDSRKIACTLNIDDTNIGLIGWLLRKFSKNK